MKKFKQLLCLALALTISASLLAACGQKDNGGSKDSDEKVLTYAVEGGSAGEEIALEKGWKVTTLEDQAAALMEVASGTSDAAIIDLLMAGAMIGEGTSYPDLTYTDRLTEEEYGIGCRKGSDLAQYINCVLGDAYQSGTMQKLAQQYGITEELLVPQQEVTFTAGEDSDVSYIQQKGTLVVGITEFAPMDYKDENGQWIGFDADLAKLVAERLGVEIQFVVIDWGQKINELDSKAIDVVWNGMTLTDGVMSAMACFSVTDTSVFSGSLPPRPIQSSTSTSPASKDTASTAMFLPAFMIEPPLSPIQPLSFSLLLPYLHGKVNRFVPHFCAKCIFFILSPPNIINY